MYELTERHEIEQKVKDEGDYKGFVYHDVACEIKRVGGMGHLCGYLHLDRVTEDVRDIIDEHFHGGITYENDDVYGFECIHLGDLTPRHLERYEMMFSNYETYKTMAYVELCLKRTIDELIHEGVL